MYLRLLTTLLLLWPAVAWAASGTIGEIRIEGNQRVEASAIHSVLSAKPGEAYDPAVVDHDVKAIFGTGRFRDVSSYNFV